MTGLKTSAEERIESAGRRQDLWLILMHGFIDALCFVEISIYPTKPLDHGCDTLHAARCVLLHVVKDLSRPHQISASDMAVDHYCICMIIGYACCGEMLKDPSVASLSCLRLENFAISLLPTTVCCARSLRRLMVRAWAADPWLERSYRERCWPSGPSVDPDPSSLRCLFLLLFPFLPATIIIV